jgi:pimeloyl-ACP methyl ester carboxylesterase
MAIESPNPIQALPVAPSAREADPAAAVPDPGGPKEGCPPPLGWAEVLESFRSQSRTWQIERGDAILTGRTFGEGRPLYFLNGIAGTHELFCLLAWLLQEDFRCVLFDYPIAGRNRPRTPLSIDGLVADLLAIADAQGDRSFSLFATSFGSTVALQGLAGYPDRIERAVIQGGFAYRRLSRLERMLCRVGRLLPGRAADLPFREVIHQVNHRRSFPPFDSTRWSFFVEDAGRTSVRDLAERASVVATFDFRPRLAEIEQPVLLIQAENEGLVSAGCHLDLERGLRNVKIEFLHTSGHLCYLTHPHRVAKLMRSFFGIGESCTAPSPSEQSRA